MKILAAVQVLALLASFGGRPRLEHTRIESPPDSVIAYPGGYRRWTRVSSALVGPQNAGFAANGGIHHIYANDKAIEGYLNGRFPDGAVIVADFLLTQENAGVTTEGARRRIDVMVKDSKRFGASAGWGFEQFSGDSQTNRLVTPAKAASCLACHSQRKDKDYVFSVFRSDESRRQ
ncbi:MAG TPA: cytochrome P460 family protein [Gemmatimonadaceae bacterium]